MTEAGATGLAAVILAGGEGSRIGGAKALRLLRGRTLLSWALANAGCQAEKIAVSLREPLSEECTKRMCILFDKPTISGPIAGLATAIDWARDEGAEWLLSIPCDTPFVPADLAERLLFAATAAAAPAAIAQSNGVRHPACGLWSTRLGDALARYLARGRLSLIGFVDSIEGEPITWPTDPFDPFFNVNTRAELAEAEGIAAKFDLTQRLADAS